MHVLLILELKNMHTLLQPLPEALKILTTEFELYIRKSGMESIVAAAGSDPSHFITCIQSLNEKFMAMVKNVFNGEDEFHSSLERVGIANLLQLKIIIESYLKNAKCSDNGREGATWCPVIVQHGGGVPVFFSNFSL